MRTCLAQSKYTSVQVFCYLQFSMAYKSDSGSGTSKESLEEQMKKAVDTALAGLGDDSGNELHAGTRGVGSFNCSAGLKPLMEQMRPSSQEEDRSALPKSSFPVG